MYLINNYKPLAFSPHVFTSKTSFLTPSNLSSTSPINFLSLSYTSPKNRLLPFAALDYFEKEWEAIPLDPLYHIIGKKRLEERVKEKYYLLEPEYGGCLDECYDPKDFFDGHDPHAKILVLNLPPDYQRDINKFDHLLKKAGKFSKSVTYWYYEKKERGITAIMMETAEQARKAVDMFHHYEIEGSRLTVIEDADLDVDDVVAALNKLEIPNADLDVDDVIAVLDEIRNSKR